MTPQYFTSPLCQETDFIAFEFTSDQQHLETNLRAKIAKVSLLLSFMDEEERHCCTVDANKGNAGFYVHYMNANFQDLLLVLQVMFYVFVVGFVSQYLKFTGHFVGPLFNF